MSEKSFRHRLCERAFHTSLRQFFFLLQFVYAFFVNALPDKCPIATQFVIWIQMLWSIDCDDRIIEWHAVYRLVFQSRMSICSIVSLLYSSRGSPYFCPSVNTHSVRHFLTLSTTQENTSVMTL